MSIWDMRSILRKETIPETVGMAMARRRSPAIMASVRLLYLVTETENSDHR